jgi:hypothetical protein
MPLPGLGQAALIKAEDDNPTKSPGTRPSLVLDAPTVADTVEAVIQTQEDCSALRNVNRISHLNNVPMPPILVLSVKVILKDDPSSAKTAAANNGAGRGLSGLCAMRDNPAKVVVDPPLLDEYLTS